MPIETLFDPSAHSGDGEADRCSGGEARPVAGHNDEVAVGSALRAGEVDSVVPAEPVRFSQLTGPSHKRIVDADDIDLVVHLVELVHSSSELPSRDSPHPLRLCQRSPTFGVEQRDGLNAAARLPGPRPGRRF